MYTVYILCISRFQIQFLAIMYNKMHPDDMVALSKGFMAMVNACSESGGAQVRTRFEVWTVVINFKLCQVCNCTTQDPRKPRIRDPSADPTETFFCLPDSCLCKDGSIEKIKLWVLNKTYLIWHHSHVSLLWGFGCDKCELCGQPEEGLCLWCSTVLHLQ